jgi:hypothetical protein
MVSTGRMAIAHLIVLTWAFSLVKVKLDESDLELLDSPGVDHHRVGCREM